MQINVILGGQLATPTDMGRRVGRAADPYVQAWSAGRPIFHWFALQHIVKRKFNKQNSLAAQINSIVLHAKYK